mmetsp:Transcript_16320/g.22605  ORF Transcript_16320/g.22605 Transcript_16320/m.22605 type:complete len:140 (+) Transcript_16320:139-558(+)
MLLFGIFLFSFFVGSLSKDVFTCEVYNDAVECGLGLRGTSIGNFSFSRDNVEGCFPLNPPIECGKVLFQSQSLRDDRTGQIGSSLQMTFNTHRYCGTQGSDERSFYSNCIAYGFIGPETNCFVGCHGPYSEHGEWKEKP